jgi:protein-tyrosine phosphatase
LQRPFDTGEAVAAFAEAFDRAASERVEVACRGGIGRTGCGLALMAVPPGDAVSWVRAQFHRRAVETPWQRRWVERIGRSLTPPV